MLVLLESRLLLGTLLDSVGYVPALLSAMAKHLLLSEAQLLLEKLSL